MYVGGLASWRKARLHVYVCKTCCCVPHVCVNVYPQMSTAGISELTGLIAYRMIRVSVGLLWGEVDWGLRECTHVGAGFLACRFVCRSKAMITVNCDFARVVGLIRLVYLDILCVQYG